MARLVISKQQVLGPCELRLDVFQELGGSKDTVAIGSVTINLSEYAGSGLISRRYLLDDCKFNSTIKVSYMRQKSCMVSFLKNSVYHTVVDKSKPKIR